METMGPEERAAILKWNSFLESLLEAEKIWDDLLELKLRLGGNLDKLPPEVGKFFGLATARSTFPIALERLLNYSRKYISLRDMIVKLPQEEKEEKPNVRRR